MTCLTEYKYIMHHRMLNIIHLEELNRRSPAGSDRRLSFEAIPDVHFISKFLWQTGNAVEGAQKKATLAKAAASEVESQMQALVGTTIAPDGSYLNRDVRDASSSYEYDDYYELEAQGTAAQAEVDALNAQVGDATIIDENHANSGFLIWKTLVSSYVIINNRISQLGVELLEVVT